MVSPYRLEKKPKLKRGRSMENLQEQLVLRNSQNSQKKDVLKLKKVKKPLKTHVFHK